MDRIRWMVGLDWIGWMDGWMDWIGLDWMDGWIRLDEWMDGWIRLDEWMDRIGFGWIGWIRLDWIGLMDGLVDE